MVTLFHVSSHKLRPDNVLRLVLPTPHCKNHTVLEKVQLGGNSGPAESGASPWKGSDGRG